VSAASAPPSPGLVQILVIEVLVAVLILYRSIRTYRGRVLRVARLVMFPVLTLLLWLAAEAETALTVPWTFPWWTAVDVGLVVVAAAATLPLAPRLLSVFQASDGQWMYRYGIELIAFYLTVWVVRLALAVYYDPNSLEFTFTTAPAISAAASEALQIVQLLFSLSTGLVVGRSISTYRMYRQASARTPAMARPLA
jgi:hypothetical protein